MISSKSLPYFGKINSISRIIKVNDDENKHYLIKRYDYKGIEKKEDFIVPINLKNTKEIIEDYCKDVRDYLVKYETKYTEYKNKKKVFNLNISLEKLKLLNKITKFGICLGAILIGSSFSVVTLPMILWAGMTILVASSVGIIVISDINKELVQTQFVNNYDNYLKQLNEYKSCLDSKLKTKLTEYNGLIQEKNKGNNLKLKKIKALN